MNEKEPQQKSNYLLLRYASLGFQLLSGIGLSVYAGLWLDKQFKTGMPLLVWLLPLLVISVSLYKLIKDTGKKK